MPIPPTQQIRVVRYAEGWGYSALEWQCALKKVEWSGPSAADGPTCLKCRATHECLVWQATLSLPHHPVEVVLKVQQLDGWWPVIRSWLGSSKGHRQWRGAQTLNRSGFRAASGIALLRGQNAHGPCELLVLESIPGKTVLEHLADQDLTVLQEHALADTIGQHLGRLADAGLTNRDPKPSNLIVQWNTRGPHIVLLDTVAIRRTRRNAIRQTQVRARMLRDLLLEPMGCGLNPRNALKMRVLRAAQGQKKQEKSTHSRNALWREVARLVDEHGDPAPVDDPLGSRRNHSS